MTGIERFWAKVNKEGPEHPTLGRCWQWLGTLNEKGYGKFWIATKHVKAHRFVLGEIPPTFTVDHLCRNRACVNPRHLEPVPHIVNVRRGDTGKHFGSRTQCPQGHAYDEANTYWRPTGGRGCKACAKIRDRRHRVEEKAA